MGKCKLCKRECDSELECVKVGEKNICKDCLVDLRQALGIDKLEKRIEILDRAKVEEVKEESDWR